MLKKLTKLKLKTIIIEGILFFSLIFLGGLNCKKEIDSKLLQKQGSLYYEKGKTEPFSGKVIGKNAKGEIISSTSYDDGIMHGELKKWHSGGRLMSLVVYKKGKLEGEAVYYYKNGQKRAVFHYSKGLTNGINQFWYKNGKLKEEAFYKNGKYEGTLKKWDKNGKLIEKSVFKNGIKIK